MHYFRVPRAFTLQKIQKKGLFYESSRYNVTELESKFISKSQEEGGMRFWLQRLPDLEEIRYSVASDQYKESLDELKLSRMFVFPRDTFNTVHSVDDMCASHLSYVSDLSETFQSNIVSLSFHVPANVLLDELLAKTLISQTRLLCRTNNIKIGYHLSTETLHNLVDRQVEKVTASFSSSNIDFVSLAVNPFTIKSAVSISQHLNTSINRVPIYAMEVLRCHPVMPGQVNASYEYWPLHIRRFAPEPLTTHNTDPNVVQNTANIPPKIVSSQSNGILSEEERLCIHDLHMAFDRAIAMEKALLAKHPEKVAELVTACVAHNLSRRHFTYIEEFDYLVETQVKPQFEKLGKSKDQDNTVKNWIILQRPILNYLFSSYRSFLASRQLTLSRSIAKVVSARIMPDSNESDSEGLKLMPYRLAALAKQAVHAEDAGLTLTTVGRQTNEETIPKMTTKAIVEVYEEIGRVYKDHYHTET